MNKKIVMATVSMFILAGCAGSIKPDTVRAENGSSVDVLSVPALPKLNNNFMADNKLRVVTPNHNAVMKGLAILTALTGNFDSGSFDKESYKGEEIDSLKNPTDIYFVPKAKKDISQWMNKNAGGYIYKQPFHIGHATWMLMFKDSTANNPTYELKYKVIFYKEPENGNVFSEYIVAECTPTPVEATLANWSANNYKKVIFETEKYMDSCLLELNNQHSRLLKK